MNLQSDSAQKIYLDIISRSSSRINDLINDRLFISRLPESIPEKYSIYCLIEDALITINDRIVLKNITVRKVYSTQDCRVMVHKQKINIALCNLIISAIDRMQKDKGVLTLVTKSIKGKCVIEIQDNGYGFKKKSVMDSIKSYFTHKWDGFNLGLFATLDILRSGHIKVYLKSEEGKGTRFILSFLGNQYSEKLF